MQAEFLRNLQAVQRFICLLISDKHTKKGPEHIMDFQVVISGRTHAYIKYRLMDIPQQENLMGKKWIEYINNSQDKIRRIYLNTFQDVYRKGSTEKL